MTLVTRKLINIYEPLVTPEGKIVINRKWIFY